MRPYEAHATAEKKMNQSFECLPYPPYSPDLTPRDYHVFEAIEGSLGGMKFSTDSEIKRSFLHGPLEDFSFLQESKH